MLLRPTGMVLAWIMLNKIMLMGVVAARVLTMMRIASTPMTAAL
jgi:hypothetical protein